MKKINSMHADDQAFISNVKLVMSREVIGLIMVLSNNASWHDPREHFY